MNDDIALAVRERRRLRFVHNGKPRLVEPQCYGTAAKGNELLRAHQLQGFGDEGHLLPALNHKPQRMIQIKSFNY